MASQICKHCNTERVKKYLKTYRGVSIYVGDQEQRWYGSRCPDCYKQYKLEYDKKRRLDLGHVPLGEEFNCLACGSTHKMENGLHRTCKAKNEI